MRLGHLVGHEGAVGVLHDGRERAVVVEEHRQALAGRARRERLEGVQQRGVLCLLRACVYHGQQACQPITNFPAQPRAGCCACCASVHVGLLTGMSAQHELLCIPPRIGTPGAHALMPWPEGSTSDMHACMSSQQQAWNTLRSFDHGQHAQSSCSWEPHQGEDG